MLRPWSSSDGICKYDSIYAKELRRIYLESRQQTFHWFDTSAYELDDFDQATQNEVIRVALVAGKSVGFISWYEPENFIHNLFIDKNYRNQGIGKALLNHCLAELGRPSRLKCLQENVKALGFYQSQGWQIEAEGKSDNGLYYWMRID
ncbi:N-acetyltransferase [Fibrisoma montanum]|uniref:N-acetyltransferase n=2 Tax=Fibrisoma montanum TaxID=2305895 RepID=A0A418MK18_9BACT|nr:N-acetyltransferase [Fibrisoma montanum]